MVPPRWIPDVGTETFDMRYADTPIPVSVLLCLLIFAGPLAAETRDKAKVEFPPRDREVSVLFIGNSYTYCNRLPQMVRAIAADMGCRLKVDVYARGGASYDSHWRDKKARAKLADGKWDAVVLQDQSLMPVVRPASTIRGGRLWVEQVKKKAARAILLMTWARRGKPEMQDKLKETYCRLARESGADVAPVGLAWAKVLTERPKSVLHTKDGSHPTRLGSYLAACVIFATIYDVSPEGAAGAGGMAAEITRYLQKTAWRTVRDFRGRGTAATKPAEAPRKPPTADEVKKFLESRTQPFGVRDAVAKWGQPRKKNEKQWVYVYRLKDGGTLWLAFTDSRSLKKATIMPLTGQWITIDIARQKAPAGKTEGPKEVP